MKKLAFILTAAFVSGSLFANVKLNNLFSDNSVLQRGMEVPVWGWADEGEKVTVEFAGQTITTVATNGKWMVKLKPMRENSQPQEMTVKGNNTLKIKNILIGEVWICSGQSNMEWALFRTIGGEEAVANSRNDQLRLFVVPHNVQMKPVDNVNAKWVLSEPQSTKMNSAVGYYFMSKLQKELNVPVGMLEVAFGGTVIESWLSQEALNAMPNKDKYMDLATMKAEYDKKDLELKPIRDAWQKSVDSCKQNNLPAPPRPSVLPSEFKGTTTIYNGEICPIVPFAVKGIAWYQGESNAYVKRADSYASLLPAMIKLWRNDWQRPDMPFIIFQITPNRKPQTDPNEKSGVAIVQEAQLKASQTVSKTALVVTMDVAESDVHYKNKQPIGERAFKAAMNLAYGKNIEYCGPIYKSMKVDGDKVVLDFTHLAGGLVQKGDTLKGFVVAGEDKKFVFAEAKIKGNSVVVSSPKVLKPVAVRYGWADFPAVNLFNKEGIPASPFRTDDWDLNK
ncbi:MAG: sialate O-acetylesterase [Bacteroidales bacterium]